MVCPIGVFSKLEAVAVVENRQFWSFFLEALIPHWFVVPVGNPVLIVNTTYIFTVTGWKLSLFYWHHQILVTSIGAYALVLIRWLYLSLLVALIILKCGML